MEKKEIIDKINSLKKEKNAVILVHNYQPGEVYEVADFLGDSLGLSRKAQSTDADIIVFAGVKFMAETAKILSPEKTVLIPDMNAGCRMADMVGAKTVRELKKKFPGVPVVSYVNTTAEVKALSDICCTSANAEKVVNSIENKDIIFLPDKNLGQYVVKKTGKNIIIPEGYCYVHNHITTEMIEGMKKAYPDAEVIAHPECTPEVQEISDAVESTSGMIRYARESPSKEFIIATEKGMVERMRREIPDKAFHEINMRCVGMKQINLEKILASLEKNQYIVSVPQEVMNNARNALEKMIAIK